MSGRWCRRGVKPQYLARTKIEHANKSDSSPIRSGFALNLNRIARPRLNPINLRLGAWPKAQFFQWVDSDTCRRSAEN
jgi:hypothetical protein